MSTFNAHTDSPVGSCRGQRHRIPAWMALNFLASFRITIKCLRYVDRNFAYPTTLIVVLIVTSIAIIPDTV